MLDSIPVPLQAIVWPLLGAVVIVGLSRFLPLWLRQLVALLVCAASLAALWSLRAGQAEPVELFWDPLNSFRLSPALYAGKLALLAGGALVGITAAAVLGIRGAAPRRTAWHGLILVALAGCLIVAMAANLVTLALGSALIDLALIAMAISFGGPGLSPHGREVTWPVRLAVPGIASTLLLWAAAVLMDAETGTASLLAREIPPQVLTMLGVSGLLRLTIFPLHPRGLNLAEHAVTSLLPFGTGLYLVVRAQSLSPLLAGASWMWVLGGVTVLIGGGMAWLSSIRPRPADLSEPWLGFAAHQTGLALVFVIVWTESAPWPLISLLLALGSLAIWWDSSLERQIGSRPAWLGAILAWVRPRWDRVRALVATRLSRYRPVAAGQAFIEQWRSPARRKAIRRVRALLPALALLALAGAPFTAGAITRWYVYGSLLRAGKALLLVTVMIADSLLVAGLWATSRAIMKQARRAPRPAALVAMLGLTVGLIVLGVAHHPLSRRFGLTPAGISGVSVVGVGLLYGFPWLVGSWLARMTSQAQAVGGTLETVRRIARLDWLYRALVVVGQRIVTWIYWIGTVGEGEGWWGWALIILAVGALFLTVR